MLLHAHFLGTLEYQQAWDLQNRLAAEVAAGEHPPTLLLLEHSHVYTFGRRGDLANLLWDEDELARRNIAVHWVDRGGDVTYHGPGQLVGYPILPLAEGEIELDPQTNAPRLPQRDYIGYLRKLEEALIQTLAGYGIESMRVEGDTGVWVPGDKFPAKIASIGVKVDARGISRHGFALNINPDMTYWDGIIACGLENQTKASMVDYLNPVPNTQEVAQAAAQAFAQVFECQLVWQLDSLIE